MVRTFTEQTVREGLAAVMDPEIPACSIADLGMIADVRVTDGAVEIDLLPTYSGCPALEVIREEAERAAGLAAPGSVATVRFVNAPPWTTDRMNDAARAAMASIGIAPPQHPDPGPGSTGEGHRTFLQVGAKPQPCPYCGSDATRLESAFGPTPCRTIAYCPACRNPFEGFKTRAAPAGRSE